MLKKQYFKNLNCMMFDHVDAVPEIARRAVLDEPSDDTLSASSDEEAIPQPELNPDLPAVSQNPDVVKVQEVPEEVLDSPIDEPQITSTETLPPL